MLHNVKESICKSVGPIADYAVTADQLENFILSREGWSAISPDKLDSLPKNEKGLLLTFDDGYLDNLTTALPILERYQVPCVIFCTTGFIDKSVYPYELELAEIVEHHEFLNLPDHKNKTTIESHTDKKRAYKKMRLPLKNKEFNKKERFLEKLAEINDYDREKFQTEQFLSWNDVFKLSQHPLVTIGAHSVHHEPLAKQSIIRAYNEISRSKKIIEEKINTKVSHFSYPYGSNSFFIRQLLRILSYNFAYTTAEKKVVNISMTNKVAIPRFDIKNLI